MEAGGLSHLDCPESLATPTDGMASSWPERGEPGLTPLEQEGTLLLRDRHKRGGCLLLPQSRLTQSVPASTPAHCPTTNRELKMSPSGHAATP